MRYCLLVLFVCFALVSTSAAFAAQSDKTTMRQVQQPHGTQPGKTTMRQAQHPYGTQPGKTTMRQGQQTYGTQPGKTTMRQGQQGYGAQQPKTRQLQDSYTGTKGIRANPETKVYHNANCQYYTAKGSSVHFANGQAAQRDGYRACKKCGN